MKWWRVLFPESPARVQRREDRAHRGNGLTDPKEFAAIRRRHRALERRVDQIEATLEVLLGIDKEAEDATGTD